MCVGEGLSPPEEYIKVKTAPWGNLFFSTSTFVFFIHLSLLPALFFLLSLPMKELTLFIFGEKLFKIVPMIATRRCEDQDFK